MKKLASVIAAATIAVGTCFAFASCERKPLVVKTGLETGWTIESMQLEGESEATRQGVYFSVTRDNQEIREVWVNVGAITPDTATLTVCSLTSTSATTRRNEFSFELSRSELKKSSDGWVQIKSDWDADNNVVLLESQGGVRINEVVFIGEEGEKLIVSVSKANVFYLKDGKVFGEKGMTIFSDLDEDHDPSNLTDEQAKFVR